MTLVLSLNGLAHRLDCHAMGRIYKGLAPDMPEADVAAFLVARKLVGCGACLREYREAA